MAWVVSPTDISAWAGPFVSPALFDVVESLSRQLLVLELHMLGFVLPPSIAIWAKPNTQPWDELQAENSSNSKVGTRRRTWAGRFDARAPLYVSPSLVPQVLPPLLLMAGLVPPSSTRYGRRLISPSSSVHGCGPMSPTLLLYGCRPSFPLLPVRMVVGPLPTSQPNGDGQCLPYIYIWEWANFLSCIFKWRGSRPSSLQHLHMGIGQFPPRYFCTGVGRLFPTTFSPWEWAFFRRVIHMGLAVGLLVRMCMGRGHDRFFC